MIPKNFNKDGLLTEGTYKATFNEIVDSVIIQGNGTSKNWDKEWRMKLLKNSMILVNQLWEVGVEEVFLDGSFVEEKDHPNDIDGYFDTQLSLDVEGVKKFEKMLSDLNDLDPHKSWNWETRVNVPGSSKKQIPMWVFYNVELYPHLKGSSSGICDEDGNEQTFPAAFRKSRTGFKKKGIIQVIKERKND